MIPEEHKQQPLDSVYDLYGLITQTYSRNTLITRDYTLGNLNSEVLQQPFIKFFVEQLKVIQIIRNFIVIPKDTLNKIYRPETTEKLYRHILGYAEDTKILLSGELESMTILSRSQGEILKSILQHGAQPPPTIEAPPEQKEEKIDL